MKFKFYQPKQTGFIKISLPIILEFDLVFLLIFIFFWNFEIVNSIFSRFKI
jgi:hypothetical protein